MRILKLPITSLLGAGALALSTLSAGAVISDVLTVYDASGAIIHQVTATELSELGAPNNLWTIDHGIANAAQLGFATALVEPNGTISDVFGVANDGTGLVLAFMSDDNLDLTMAQGYFGPQAGWTLLPEQPIAYDATKYVNPVLHPGATATFTSDVPDGGATVGLLGLVLATVAGVSRKLRE